MNTVEKEKSEVKYTSYYRLQTVCHIVIIIV